MKVNFKFVIFLLFILSSSCGPQPKTNPQPARKPEEPTLVAQDKYLQKIIGISESALIQAFNDPNSPLPAKLATRDVNGFFSINNSENNQSFKAGRFEHDKTVKALIDQSSKLPMPGKGSFSIVDGSAFPHKVKEVDVAWLQAQSENRLAVFQVASNQNGLEQISASKSVEEQRLEAYPNDPTQGPIASVSAAPGILIRWGYAYFDKNTKPNTWRQRNAHQINFLQSLKALPVNQAGYVIWENTPTQLPEPDDYQKIIIAYHEGIQVTFGRRDTQSYPFFIEPDQIIDQVFCAALALHYQNAQVDVNSPAVVAWSKMVLTGIYEGTIRYAHLKGRKKLFLTSVGGGVFGNEQDWIDDAMVRMKDYIIASGLEVVLVNYQGQVSQKLMQLLKDTSGCYQQFDPEGKVIKSSGTCK